MPESGKHGWETWVGSGEGGAGMDKENVWKSRLAKVREKSRPVEGCYFFGAKSGHFPLGFESCQVHALAKTCTDLADIADAKQEAGLRTSSHL